MPGSRLRCARKPPACTQRLQDVLSGHIMFAHQTCGAARRCCQQLGLPARLLLVYGCAKAIVYMGWDFKGAIASAPTCVCACALPPRQLRRVVPPTKQCSVVCFALVFVGTIGGSFARRIRLPSARLTHVVLPMPHDARRLAAQLPIAGCMCSDAWPSVSWERKGMPSRAGPPRTSVPSLFAPTEQVRVPRVAQIIPDAMPFSCRQVGPGLARHCLARRLATEYARLPHSS